MRDFKTPRTFILSAYRSNQPASVNRLNHSELACDLALEGLSFSACEGSFEGEYEQGYVVVGAHATLAIVNLALLYRQDSYLVVAENDRTAYLVDPDTGYHTHIGKFGAVGTLEPDADAWTLLDGTFYTVDPTNGPDLERGF